MSFEQKYLKYKNKYLNLKGGGFLESQVIENNTRAVDDFIHELKNMKSGQILYDILIRLSKSSLEGIDVSFEKLLDAGAYPNYIHNNLDSTRETTLDYLMEIKDWLGWHGDRLVDILKRYGAKKFSELPDDAPGKNYVHQLPRAIPIPPGINLDPEAGRLFQENFAREQYKKKFGTYPTE